MNKQFSIDGSGKSFEIKYKGKIKYTHFGLPCSIPLEAGSKKSIEQAVKAFKKVCDEQEVKEMEYVDVEFTEVTSGIAGEKK